MVSYRLAAIFKLLDALRRVRYSEPRQCPLIVKFYLETLGHRPQVPSISLTSIEICFEMVMKVRQ